MASRTALAVAARYAQYLPREVEAVAADLDSFCELLTKWNRTQNLVSRETDELWQRHIGDSLQLVRFIRPTDRQCADLGSGGGFPALPLAVALKGSGRSHLLIEANAKKSSFLRAAIRELGLDARVESSRAEAIKLPSSPDLVTARAVAPLDVLIRLSAPLLAAGGRALFHKGREYDEELRAAADHWRFDVIQHASDTDSEAVILDIRNISPRL